MGLRLVLVGSLTGPDLLQLIHALGARVVIDRINIALMEITKIFYLSLNLKTTYHVNYHLFYPWVSWFCPTIWHLFIVRQQSAAIVERFGKFVSVRQSGLQIKIPIIDRVSGRVSLRVQQLDVVVETKTKDDVFVKLKVSVQYKVIKDKVFDAFYKLDFPQDQITSYVFDVVRAEVPKMILDDVFEKKDDIAIAVKSELNDSMLNYGFDIIKTLVTDIDPDAQVKDSMNRINASEREKVAAQFEGDAQRILIVERAKAEAESKPRAISRL